MFAEKFQFNQYSSNTKGIIVNSSNLGILQASRLYEVPQDKKLSMNAAKAFFVTLVLISFASLIVLVSKPLSGAVDSLKLMIAVLLVIVSSFLVYRAFQYRIDP